MPLTPRENLRALLDRRSPEWIPFSLDVGALPGLTRPVLERFRQNTGAADPAEHFNFDWRTSSLACRYGGRDPRDHYTDLEPGTTFDEWGIGHAPSAIEGTVARSYPPLAHAETVADIEAHPAPIIDPHPDPARIADYHDRGYAVFGYGGSIYEWSWWLRGMEKFLMGTASRPDLTDAIVAKVAGHTRQLALASARAGIDVLCFYDDVGMQTGMQISPKSWRRFIRPHWEQILTAIRAEFPHVRTLLHSCGGIRSIVPDIVEIGFDILHPVQPECMDFADVHREFGRHITLCATLSAQRIFPFGSPDEVRAEVRRLKQIAGPERRCILCPSNMIQPETPWENILAFAEAARA